MRPKSVVLAERLYLASIAILVLISVLTWDAAVAQGGVILAGGVTAFGIGLSLLLLILTTRKASRIALWLLIALTALGALGVAVQVSNGILATGLNGVLTSGRPRALCVGRFEDGWPKDRPCRHVGRLYVSGDTTRGLEVPIAWPQARCPRQIVSATPRHFYETASRSETRSARRRTCM